MLFAQTDSAYSYTYNCTGCGTFTTVATEPIEVETSVVITTDTLSYTSHTTLASFVLSAARKSKPANAATGNRFNVYPNPAREKYYLNFESKEEGNVRIVITDLLGKKVMEESFLVSKGMNVKERITKDLMTGHYIVKAETSKDCFVKKLFVGK